MVENTTLMIIILSVGSIIAVTFLYYAVKESQRLNEKKKYKKKKRGLRWMIVSKLIMGGILFVVVWGIIRMVMLDSKNLDIH